MAKELRPDDPRTIKLAKHDSYIRFLLDHHFPITRHSYLVMSYPFDPLPKPGTWEHVDEIPEPLQHWSKVHRKASHRGLAG